MSRIKLTRLPLSTIDTTNTPGIPAKPSLGKRLLSAGSMSLEGLLPKKKEARSLEPALTPPKPHVPTDRRDEARENLEGLDNVITEDVRRLEGGGDGELHVVRFLVPNTAGGTTQPVTAQEGSATGVHATLGANGLAAGASDDVTAGATRAGMGINTMAGENGGKTSVWGDFTAMGVGQTGTVYQSGDTKVSLRGDVFGSVGGMGGASLGVTYKTSAGAMGLGPQVWLSAKSRFKVISAYEGSDPTLQGKLLVEWGRTVSPSGGFDVGFGAHSFGIGGKLMITRTHQAIYQQYLAPETVADVLKKRGTVRNTFEALGLTKAPVKRTPLKELLPVASASSQSMPGLMPGESVSLVVSGTFTLGVSAGGYGLRGGVSGTYTGESELSLRRLDADWVELVVSPKRSMAASASVDALMVADAYYQGSLALAMKESYGFNISTPSGEKDLRAALDGILPSTAVNLSPIAPSDSRDMALLSGFEAMPETTRRQHIEKAQRSTSRLGAGVPKPFVAIDERVAGLGHHRTQFREKLVVANEKRSLLMNTHGFTTETHQLLRGISKRTVVGTHRELTVAKDDGTVHTTFDGLEFNLSYEQDRVKGSMRNSMATSINKAFDKAVPAFRRAGRTQTYKVNVQGAALSAEDLLQLSHTAHETTHRVARKTGMSARPLHKMAQALRSIFAAQGNVTEFSTETLAQCAQVVQGYVVSQRKADLAMGAVHALLNRGDDALNVSTQSSAYSEPFEQARDLFIKHPVDSLADNKARKRAHREAKTVTRALRHAVSDLNDDQVARSFNEPAMAEPLLELSQKHAEVVSFMKQLEEAQIPAQPVTPKLKGQ